MHGEGGKGTPSWPLSRADAKAKSRAWPPWGLFPHPYGFFLERKHYSFLGSWHRKCLGHSFSTNLSWTVIYANSGLCRAIPIDCFARVYGQADLTVPSVTFSTGTFMLIWSEVNAVGIRITDLFGAWVDSLWKKKQSKWIIAHSSEIEDEDWPEHLHAKQSLGRLNFS